MRQIHHRFALGLLLALPACGGSSEETPGGNAGNAGMGGSMNGTAGQPNAGASSGGASGGNAADCPASAPAADSDCELSPLTACEYGDDTCRCINDAWRCGEETLPDNVPMIDEEGNITNPEGCPATEPSGACEGQVACLYAEAVCYCGTGTDWSCFNASAFGQ